MRILVTGGSGFVGTEVVRQLLELGHQVRVYDLVNSSHPGVENVITSSILDPISLMDAALGCDAIMHLAAIVGVNRTESRRLECMSVNVQGTINILQAAVSARVKKILIVSSSEVYGDITDGSISETSPLNPKSNYSISKLCGEEYARAFSDQFGLEYTVVRFFSVYGPGQADAFVMSSFVEAVRDGKNPLVFGDGLQKRAFCYVEDAARGAIMALLSENSSGETINIGNDHETVTVAEVAERIIALCRPDEGLALRYVPLENTRRGKDREIYRRVPDITKARTLLQYEPQVHLDEGIVRLWDRGARRLDKESRAIFDIVTEDSMRDAKIQDSSDSAQPKISVIIRNYNQGHFIENALSSILNQSLDSSLYEVLVVDDGSTDESRDLLRKFEKQTCQHFLEHQGHVHALNAGIREAKGEYITILDADDWAEPTLLEDLLQAIEANPHAEFSYCNYWEESREGETKIITLDQNIFDGLAAGFMHKKSLLAKIGGYDEKLKLPEYDVLAQLLKTGEGAHVPKALYHYRRHAQNMTNDTAMVDQAREDVAKRHGGSLKFRSYES